MRRFLVLLIPLLLLGCAYPQRTIPLTKLDFEAGYRFETHGGAEDDDTLVVVSLSGGGTRAAALALGTLKALAASRIPARSSTLLEEVDILSSVSGGSVTAAQFALYNTAGFETLERDFLKQDVMTSVLAGILNPVSLVRLPSPAVSRIDFLVSEFRDRLFGDRTYGQLPTGRNQPFLIINAADMTSGTVFPFTQEQFDLICADLEQFKIAEAVAASAAFPIALTALTLENFSNCDAQQALGDAWPPEYLVTNLGGADPYDNPQLLRRARRQAQYLNRPNQERRKAYVHLLDGGIADNLGLSEPLNLITSLDYNDPIFDKVAAAVIRNIVFVIVNARSEAARDWDLSASPPGIFDMVFATTGSAIDNATFSTLDRQSGLEKLVKGYFKDQLFDAEDQRIIDNLNFFTIPIDFDVIRHEGCRDYLKNIDTSWALDESDVDLLMAVGAALVYAAPDYQRLSDALGIEPDAPRDLSQVCADHWQVDPPA